MTGEFGLETVSCNLGCDAAGEELLFLASPDDASRPFRVVRCANCGLVYLNPRPDPQALLQLYRTDYYGYGDAKFERMTEAAVGFFVRWRAQILKRYARPGGRVLDIGCGRGNFLEQMAKYGFAVCGTEFTEDSAGRARKLFPRDVHVGDRALRSWPDRSFTLITLWHVLEHLRDPLACLREAYRLLEPGGKVVLAQPNIASLQARFGRSVWFHLDVPRHLYHFSPRTLGRLLRRAGFRVVRESHFSIEQNPFGLVQTLLNRLGLPQNHLYHVLKNENLRISKPARLGWLAAYYCLMPLATVLTLEESLFRRGGTFYVVAARA